MVLIVRTVDTVIEAVSSNGAHEACAIDDDNVLSFILTFHINALQSLGLERKEVSWA